MKTVQAAVDSYGLQTLPSSDGEVEVFEDVTAIAKNYKIGGDTKNKNWDSIKFTARVNAAYKTNLDREQSIAVAVEKEQQPIEAEIIESVVIEEPKEAEIIEAVVEQPKEAEIVEASLINEL